MRIIRVKGYNMKTHKPVKVDQEIYEILDCICDTRKDALQYMFDVALETAEDHEIMFTGFEIIAE